MEKFAEATLEGNRIRLEFEYDHADVQAVKDMPGRSFVSPENGGPAWRLPKTVESAIALRDYFGDRLRMDDDLKAWGKAKLKERKSLTELAERDDLHLDLLQDVHPELHDWLRSYQRVGAAFIANSPNPLVADQPGLGKTAMTIAGLMEAGMLDGPTLIIAPKSSLEVVWEYELGRWTDLPVVIAKGGRRQREHAIFDFHNQTVTEGAPGFMVVNHAMVRMAKTGERDAKGKPILAPFFPELQEIEWRNVVVDEAAKGALRNPKALTSQGIKNLDVTGKRILISGTPVGGKIENLWGLLNFLDSDTFSSKWNWLRTWTTVEKNKWGGNEVGSSVIDARREAFDNHLRPYILRREKQDVLTELPPKQFVDVWVEMGGRHKEQYHAMAEDAMIKFGDNELSVTSILAEYTRLRQLSGALHTWSGDTIYPTTVSPKLDAIKDLLMERGVWDSEGDERVLIFSQFSKMVDMVHEWLVENKVSSAKLTGATSASDRASMVRSYQDDPDGPRVMVISTTAGGEAITLDRADTVIFLDETWDPDDKEQASDRAHRASRMHNVTIYTILTKGSIEEYIRKLNITKDNVNRSVLDAHRQGKIRIV